jgi:hypothetical protein
VLCSVCFDVAQIQLRNIKTSASISLLFIIAVSCIFAAQLMRIKKKNMMPMPLLQWQYTSSALLA